MACDSGIEKNIISNCTNQPIGGLEATAYIMNRLEFDPTFDVTNPSKITAFTPVGSAVAFTIKGVKKNMNAGHDLVSADDMADRFSHYFNFKGFEVDAASIENLDAVNDVVVVVEYKNKPSDGDGIFVAYGVGSGLYKTADTKRANDANGTRNIELASMDQQPENYSQYNVLDTDYATTKAMLEALLTNP